MDTPSWKNHEPAWKIVYTSGRPFYWWLYTKTIDCENFSRSTRVVDPQRHPCTLAPATNKTLDWGIFQVRHFSCPYWFALKISTCREQKHWFFFVDTIKSVFNKFPTFNLARHFDIIWTCKLNYIHHSDVCQLGRGEKNKLPSYSQNMQKNRGQCFFEMALFIHPIGINRAHDEKEVPPPVTCTLLVDCSSDPQQKQSSA